MTEIMRLSFLRFDYKKAAFYIGCSLSLTLSEHTAWGVDCGGQAYGEICAVRDGD